MGSVDPPCHSRDMERQSQVNWPFIESDPFDCKASVWQYSPLFSTLKVTTPIFQPVLSSTLYSNRIYDLYFSMSFRNIHGTIPIFCFLMESQLFPNEMNSISLRTSPDTRYSRIRFVDTVSLLIVIPYTCTCLNPLWLWIWIRKRNWRMSDVHTHSSLIFD